METYKKLLKKGRKIIQKTDDREFFDFSLEEYESCDLKLTEVTYNLLENGNPEWNIVTEYEQKWVERGLPIHRVEAVFWGWFPFHVKCSSRKGEIWRKKDMPVYAYVEKRYISTKTPRIRGAGGA